jgi:iron complex outermembrane receptor protein
MKAFPRTRIAGATLFLCAASFSQAQTPSSVPSPPTGDLREVTVTGNPLGATDVAAPVTRLSGTGLLLRRQPTLGDTLSGLPGVSSTYFGPTATRPVIRGLDGDRVRILQNSGASLDASSLSYDHAVAADPIAVERIEVLRGPAALLYGGNATGGVVNLIDNRIPKEPLQGITGRVDVDAATGNRERGGAVLLEAGNARFALHADAFDRRTRDVRAPIDLACTQAGVTGVARRICNSASETRGGAVGGSVFFDRGRFGASVSEFRSNYGAVAEDEVTIGMKSTRTAVEGEWRIPGGWFTGLKLQAAHTDYGHTEFDAGAPGTVFTTRGNDVRLEARHAPLGRLQGVVGVQAEQSRFGADGAEAFAPFSRTRNRALFIHEELATGWGKLTFGARRESVDVDSLGNPTVARFTTGRRSFDPTSWAAGALWKLLPAWQLTGNLARTQRAPRDYELFAEGPHVATGAYEVGDPGLGRESSTNVDVGVQWKSGATRASLTAFQSRFSNYVALLSTGRNRDEEGNGAGAGATDCGDGTSVESGCTAELLPEFAYQGVRAQFRGLEAEGSLRLLERAGHAFDLEWRADLVRAVNRTAGQPLPRIAPARVGATGVWTQGPWSARLGVDRWSAQDRVAPGERAVSGYALWNAALTYKMPAGGAQLLWYARLDNLTDRLAYTATSILSQSAPGRVPLPGRSLRVGLRADF